MPASRMTRALCLTLLVASLSAPARAEETVATTFVPAIDGAGWWWGLQPRDLPILPNPQSEETLPVAMTQGQRERVSALRFDLFVRGVPADSEILSATLRISEGSDQDEQPPIRPELAQLRACLITAPWVSAQADPISSAPGTSNACVTGARSSGLWTFDLSALAAGWGSPSGNLGVMLMGPSGGLDATWQVNLRRAASLTVTYEPPPDEPPDPPTDGYPSENDTTGITPDAIRIGVHASITGAAPVRSDSFHQGFPRYWALGDEGGPVLIHGRRVEVQFWNDEANPSTARTVCNAMADDVFLIVGLSGPDQTKACADLAASQGVPYVSLGSVETPVRALRNAFALSATYAQQGPALASWIRAHVTFDPNRVAIIATDTGNYDDAVTSFTTAFPGVRVLRPSKTARGSQYADDVCSGPLRRFDAVYVLTNPTFFLELEGSAICAPTFVGAGMTSGLDRIADLACGGSSPALEAHFFSPAPAYADAGTYDPAFVASLQEGSGDDLLWITWAMSRSLHAMLDAAGPEPDRRGFVDAAETLEVRTGAFPDLAFSREDHFGARQAHMLRGVCGADGRGSFVTEQAFVPLG